MISTLARPHDSTGFQMIRAIDIQNFRCFEHLRIEGVRRFNLIVGDNAAGKTALLEAMFLALSGNVEVSLRLRQHRGFEGSFQGSPQGIEEAIWRDYFYNYDWRKQIQVTLNGTGADNRSMTIGRGSDGIVLPFAGYDQVEGGLLAPMEFKWRDASNHDHIYKPRVSGQGIQTGVVEEDLPNFFLFSANQTISAAETAARFSALSTEKREQLFVSIFTREYPWIESLSIEVTAGGAAMIHASIVGEKRKLPLNSISGGINRVVALECLRLRPTLGVLC